MPVSVTVKGNSKGNSNEQGKSEGDWRRATVTVTGDSEGKSKGNSEELGNSEGNSNKARVTVRATGKDDGQGQWGNHGGQRWQQGQ